MNAYRILVGKPEGKRPLGRPRHRWVDNIKMNFREIGWDDVDWIDIIIIIIYLFTAIGFAPSGSSPTLVQTKTIKQHYTVV
jgi:hypothetical protein